MTKKDTRIWWDMVLEWDEGCHHDNCRVQKLGFRHRDSFLAATRQANLLRLSMTRGCGVPPSACQIVYIGKAASLEKYLAVRTVYLDKQYKEDRARVRDITQREQKARKSKLKVKKALPKSKVSATGATAFRVRDHDV